MSFTSLFSFNNINNNMTAPNTGVLGFNPKPATFNPFAQAPKPTPSPLGFNPKPATFEYEPRGFNPKPATFTYPPVPTFQVPVNDYANHGEPMEEDVPVKKISYDVHMQDACIDKEIDALCRDFSSCLLYTSPSPRDS